MASGTIGAEEPIEKYKWSENSKVYTRKIKHKKLNNQINKDNSSQALPADNANNGAVADTTTTAATATQDKPEENGNTTVPVDENAPQRSEHAQPTEDANSPQQQQQQQQSSPLDVAASEDSSSLNRREDVPVPNGHDGNLGNGSVKPVVTLVDDRVNINLTAARSRPKQEVKELKRKLVSELDQVRNLVRELEDKESQLGDDGYSAGLGISGGGTGLNLAGDAVGSLGGYSLSQYPGNDGIDMGGGVRSNVERETYAIKEPRSFRQLSVSLTDNNHGVHDVVEKEKRTPKANKYYRNSEFLLGKDRLPPAESNKKSKSNGGRKHGGGGTDYSFGMDKQIFRSCSSLLQKLMNHKHGWVFNTPVDVKGLNLYDYFDIIKHPMDLGTVKDRLNKNWYKSPREFAEDVRLTFRNAMTYNPEGQDVHVMAEQLSNMFEKKWVEIEADYEHKLRYERVYDMGLPTPTSRKANMAARFPVPLAVSAPHYALPPPPLVPPDMRYLERSNSMTIPTEARPKPLHNAPSARAPAPKKPKAKDPDKRDMTFEEKQKLSSNLQNLPSEKLDNIVQIIKKRNSALCQRDDEIEVDIDSVDAETLWELDRFVTNYKKSLSKNKRKAELAQARARAQQSTQQNNPAPPTSVEPPKETRTEERNIGPSSPAQGAKQADSGSGSSSASSSSSDSGSSSSDSDSDSSSGSEGGQSI